ncbi:MAG: metallophosphatase family protein [Burkholderiaceae bacterium]|nr:MAG: metallophosphatase family protein [Burkholderiaceae bacterium]
MRACITRLLLGVLVLFAAAAHARAQAHAFSFIAIGDVPYNDAEADVLQQILAAIALDDSAFILHAGDIKSASAPCSDELLSARKALLDQARQPLILVPGDNEWTDCHHTSVGQHNPMERLQYLRELFFNDEYSLGQEKLRLTRQSEIPQFRPYQENVRWEYQSVLFVGLNIPGSNNNYQTAAGRNGDFEDRLVANRVWLQRAFAHVRQKHLPALVILIQADPNFEHAPIKGRDGYLELRQQLRTLAGQYEGQVLLIHGDSHHYRLDQPLKDAQGKTLKNFTRLEVFGSPLISQWIKVTVQPAQHKIFRIETRSLPAAQQ